MMLERLCKLVEDNYKHLNLSVGYNKVTDWVIEVEERISVVQSNVTGNNLCRPQFFQLFRRLWTFGAIFV